MTARIAVLVSGGGSNLKALLDHFAVLGAAAPGAVVYVASDRAEAGGLARAAERAIEHEHLDRSGRGAQLLARLTERGIDLVALAGYLRAIPSDVTGAYRGRIVNVHPSLLPAFGGPGMYGERVHQAVLQRGVRVTGVTVHFVDEAYDTGPIIEQWPVPVLPGDDARTLATRVLEVEHRVYPRVVAALAAGDVAVDAAGVVRSARGEPMDFQFAGVARATFLKGP